MPCSNFLLRVFVHQKYFDANAEQRALGLKAKVSIVCAYPGCSLNDSEFYVGLECTSALLSDENSGVVSRCPDHRHEKMSVCSDCQCVLVAIAADVKVVPIKQLQQKWHLAELSRYAIGERKRLRSFGRFLL
jgi:hypothetical protein